MGEAAAAMLAELQSETSNMKVSRLLAHPIVSKSSLSLCVYNYVRVMIRDGESGETTVPSSLFLFMVKTRL